MTFLEMQTRVGELINQAVTDDTLTVTETSVKANLNIAYRLVVNVVDGVYQNYYVRLAKSYLQADTASYAVPSTCRKLHRVEVGYVTSTERDVAHRIDRNIISDPQWSFSESAPCYALVGDLIELFPTPTSTIADGLWLWYTKDVTDMSSDSESADLPLGYDHLLVIYAAAKGKLSQGLTDEYTAFMSEFNDGLERMRQELVERATDDSDMVIVREII